MGRLNLTNLTYTTPGNSQDLAINVECYLSVQDNGAFDMRNHRLEFHSRSSWRARCIDCGLKLYRPFLYKYLMGEDNERS